MKGAGLAALLIATALGSPALACSGPDYSTATVWLPAQDMARLLYARASEVVIAVSESTRPLASAPGAPHHDDYATVTLTVVERLKGRGADRFPIGAQYFRTPPADADERLERRGDFSDPELSWLGGDIEAQDVRDMCRSAYRVIEGRRYLVFLGEDGKLLRDAIPVGWGWDLKEQWDVSGPAFEMLGEDDDPWLARVRSAADDWKAAIKPHLERR